MKRFTGIPGSPGIVMGKAFLYLGEDVPEIPHYSIRKAQVESEWKRFLGANAEAAAELCTLKERILQDGSKEQAAIFETHLMMLEDTDFQDALKESLKTRLQNIEWVLSDRYREMIEKLAASSNSYLQERGADILDISRRVLYKLLSIKKVSLTELSADVILVCHDLLPSDILVMNKKRVKGILMDVGSRTSHAAILSRAFEIPTVLGLSCITKEVGEGEKLVMDGSSGEVVIKPDRSVLMQYQQALEQRRRRSDELSHLRDLPAETKDGYRVSLKANIEIPEEAAQIARYGAEGIGLYRSEFLFLTPSQAIDEEEQYRAYSQVLKVMGNLPVTIRTMDGGGDKPLSEFQHKDEKNPLLGWRAIRLSLSRPELFKTQLRALLRASMEGNMRIMFPMISGIEELEQALALLEEAKAECRKKGHAYAEAVEVGTMIEVPSAAMTADILAERSDFFSIGTNDLIQYTLAVDRGNEHVSYLAQPSHPAVIRLIKNIIDKAHEKGIKVAMCGELAGDPSATPLLLGLELDEFSMTAQAIPHIKQIIRSADMASCRILAEEALNCISYHQVSLLVEAWMSEHFPAG